MPNRRPSWLVRWESWLDVLVGVTWFVLVLSTNSQCLSCRRWVLRMSLLLILISLKSRSAQLGSVRKALLNWIKVVFSSRYKQHNKCTIVGLLNTVELSGVNSKSTLFRTKIEFNWIYPYVFSHLRSAISNSVISNSPLFRVHLSSLTP